MSFPLFVFGMINSYDIPFDGYVIGPGSTSSRNLRPNKSFREVNGFTGWLILIASFVILIYSLINAENI